MGGNEQAIYITPDLIRTIGHCKRDNKSAELGPARPVAETNLACKKNFFIPKVPHSIAAKRRHAWPMCLKTLNFFKRGPKLFP
jgi:hypothetical protein